MLLPRLIPSAIPRALLSILALAAAAGCGGTTEEGGGAGSGAAAGSGGTGGTAGSGGTGGTAGTGGSAGTGGTAGAGGSSGTGGSAGTGGGGQSGDCTDGSATEVCPPDGSTCTELVPGGFRVCALVPEEATDCAGSGFDECCNSSECTTGACFHNSVMPGYGCGGAPPPDMNLCAADQCDDDADCAGGTLGQICAPRGAAGSPIRFCMTAACRTDADCTAEPGGICAPVKDPCCWQWDGLFCVYPSNGCRTAEDCGQGMNCIVDYDLGVGVCTTEPIGCPA